MECYAEHGKINARHITIEFGNDKYHLNLTTGESRGSIVKTFKKLITQIGAYDAINDLVIARNRIIWQTKTPRH